ncbi:MAG: FRG domain-containing protein [Actinomycetota bacterium]|nr:FRG domain-containing protein [Actinomycetota bacterium]
MKSPTGLLTLDCIEEPSTLQDLVSSLTGQDDGVRLWRGQGDIAWPLDSTLVRRERSSEFGSTETHVTWQEGRLLDRARHRQHDRLDGATLDDFELLARLRHHGAATRLVDFSRSAMVALWFAASDRPDSTGALLGIHTDYLQGHEGVPTSGSYAAEIADMVVQASEGRENLRIWEPAVVSPRVAAQHSQFAYSLVVERPYGTLKLPTEQTSGVRLIALKPPLKRECLAFLRGVMDIGWQTLFPDLDGFGRAWGAHPPEDVDRW